MKEDLLKFSLEPETSLRKLYGLPMLNQTIGKTKQDLMAISAESTEYNGVTGAALSSKVPTVTQKQTN